MSLPKLDTIGASNRLREVLTPTPVHQNSNVSLAHDCEVFLKREDLQIVRSYKIRGAYNKMISLTTDELERGVVCASAGNHAQGVAFSCNKLKTHGTIYMPSPTPKQKIEQVKMFGGDFVKIVIAGDTFDDSKNLALAFCKEKDITFIHPFDDLKVIEGQSTVAKEILEQTNHPIDYVILPLGGGGLAAGVSTYFKEHSPETKIIAVEPSGAGSYKAALSAGKPVKIDDISKFIDGAAVQQVGDLTFEYCKANIDSVLSIDEGKVCSTILKLYNKDAIVVEPAGALSLAALDLIKDEIKGKKVICIVSGSNNDITRMEEIKERSMLYENLKHYFLLKFPQRVGALKEFVNEILGPTDDITHFEYLKKNNRETGMIKIGIETLQSDHLDPLLERMKKKDYKYTYLNKERELLALLI